MLQTVNLEQTVDASGNVNFGSNVIQTGCTSTHVDDSDVIKLNKPGFYMIALSASVTTTEKKCVGEIKLLKNGLEIQGAKITQQLEAEEYENVAKSFLIQIFPDCSCNCVKEIPALITATIGDVALDIVDLQVSVTKL